MAAPAIGEYVSINVSTRPELNSRLFKVVSEAKGNPERVIVKSADEADEVTISVRVTSCATLALVPVNAPPVAITTEAAVLANFVTRADCRGDGPEPVPRSPLRSTSKSAQSVFQPLIACSLSRNAEVLWCISKRRITKQRRHLYDANNLSSSSDRSSYWIDPPRLVHGP